MVHKMGASKKFAVVRATASDQCAPGSNPANDLICGLNKLFISSYTLSKDPYLSLPEFLCHILKTNTSKLYFSLETVE